MTRIKIEFEVAIRDNDEDGFRSLASQVQHFVDDNIPALSGWAKVTNPRITYLPEGSDLTDPEGW
jgi:hypothetical protein